MTAPRHPPATADQGMTCYLIALAARLLDQVIAGRLAIYGVIPGQLPTLLALYEADGRIQAELARQVGVEQPTMALNLQRMERDGLIERRPHPNDARKAHIWLTERAWAIQQPIRALRQEIDEDALLGIPAKRQQQLRTMLTQLIANLQTLKAASSPTDQATQE